MSGRKIPIAGGSDYHKSLHPVRLAHPVMRVYSQSPSAEDILSAISRGNSYITSSVSGAMLDLRYDTAIMGETINRRDGEVLNISAEMVHPGCKLKLITSEGVVAEWKSSSLGSFQEKIKVPDTWRFAYLVLYRHIFNYEYVRAITNPVYFI